MNTPTLRFKEFSGAWEVKKTLGDVIEVMQSGISRMLNDSDVGLPVIRSNNLQNNKLDTSDLKYWYEVDDQGANLENYFLNEGDLLVNFINSPAQIGKCALYESKFLKRNVIFTTNIMRLSFNKNADYRFIFCFFQTNHYTKHIESITKPAVNQASFTTKEFKTLKIPLPTLPEQTKIANFLTAIDEKIAQLSQTAQLLTDYKKGVMQQIFSQQLRFKDDDGREFAEWDFIELEKVAFKVNAKNKDCSITNVLTNSATQGIVNQADYFDRDIANQNNLGGYYVVEIDDFVYNPRISNHALVGSLKRNNLVKGVMSPLYTVFRFKNGSLSFFEQYFETTHWHDYMKSVANSGARHDRLNITNDDFLNLPVPFPSLPEQTKIANFLTAIDDKINHNQTQWDAMKQYKAGLLQQMFV
jgi:type I restriction enzyme S subunit